MCARPWVFFLLQVYFFSFLILFLLFLSLCFFLYLHLYFLLLLLLLLLLRLRSLPCPSNFSATVQTDLLSQSALRAKSPWFSNPPTLAFLTMSLTFFAKDELVKSTWN
jgi:hypothetical protein